MPTPLRLGTTAAAAPSLPPKEHTTTYRAGTLLFFATISTCQLLINKSLLSYYSFPSKFFFLFIQQTIAIGICFVLKRIPAVQRIARIPDVNVALLKRASIPGLLSSANVVFGLWGLTLSNIPMFMAFRRLTGLVFLLHRLITTRNCPSLGDWSGVLLMALGGAVAASESGYLELVGYFLVCLNNVFTALFLLKAKAFAADNDLSPLGVTFCIALIMAPVTFIAHIVSGDVFVVLNFPWTTGLVLATLCSAPFGILLNFATYFANSVNSSFAVSATGTVRSILLTAVGAFVFPDFNPTPAKVTGLGLSVAGAVITTVTGYLTMTAKAPSTYADIETPGGPKPIAQLIQGTGYNK